MRSLILLLLCGCGSAVEVPVAALEAAGDEVVVQPAGGDAVESMTEAQSLYCQSVGRIQVEQAIRARLPEWGGTASILPGTQTFVLSEASNEHRATHLMVCRVRLYKESGNESIQIWAVYCKGGEPISAKHLHLGEYLG